MITVKSKGMRKNPYLEKHLVVPIFDEYTSATKYYGVWGIGKETNAQAEKEAKEKGLPLIRMEDGLIRSFSVDEESYSLYKSYSGVYYDATVRSNVELLLNSDWTPSYEEIQRYDLCVELIKKYNLSKYNDGVDCPTWYFPTNRKQKLLLIDQTYGDKSIEYGLANEDSFKEMLYEALSKKETHEIYIKIHPEVLMGKKKGYLLQEVEKLTQEEQNLINIISENWNTPSMFKYVDEIFVVTSQVGFDALLRNKKVYCFGAPFYSNWGLTMDYQKVNSRERKRSCLDVFVAIMLKNTSYINPFTKELGQLEDVLEYLSLRKRHQNSENVFLYKTKLWKKHSIKKFLMAKHIKFIRKLVTNETSKNFIFASWGFEGYQSMKDLPKNKMCIEDGFIRSVGLGSNIEDPLSLVCDRGGIYFNPKTESDLEKLLNNEEPAQYELEKSKQVIELLLQTRVTKYNVGDLGNNLKDLKKNHDGKQIILVPGQVESDASIKYGSVDIKTNFQLLKQVSHNRVGQIIVYKPHPDVLAGNRQGISAEKEIEELKKLYPNNIYHIEKHANIIDCFDVADEVHVITSTSGLEAILRDKKVFTYGLPFYGGYGLTVDLYKYPRPRKHLSKEELILGCYLLYPRYMLPEDNKLTNAFTAINHVSKSNKVKQEATMSISNQVKRRIRLCIKTIQALLK